MEPNDLFEPVVHASDPAAARAAAHRPIAPLFPAPRDPSTPWTRHHALKLLRRAEKAAGLTPERGNANHAFRRKWATERKHLPMVDVAAAGGWKSTETLMRCYVQADEGTMFDVMSEPRKVRISGHS